MRSWVGRTLAAMVSVLALAALTLVAVPAAQAQAATTPPEKDAFYQPPSGYESEEPGTVLRSRPATIAAAAAWPIKVRAWQLLYRTTDAQGDPTATVTTVLLPYNAKPDRSRPLLSYQVAEDSVPMKCAPSYQMTQSFNWENSGIQAELVLIAAAVRQGYAVSVPDYEGPDGAFTAGRQAGQAALDGIRAAERFSPLGLAGDDTPVGLWGYSGGALASGWTTQLHPSYAPELNVKGTAAGGLPTDLEAALLKVNKGVGAGLAVNGITGLSHAYPKLDGYLDEYLNADGRRAMSQAESQCLPTVLAENAGRDVFSYFDKEDPLNDPVPREVLADNKMGSQGSVETPMYVFHAVNDELVPIKETDAYVKDRCAEGADIQYARDVVSEHVSLAITGQAAALNWLNARLTGEPAPTGCSTQTVASTLADPLALQTFGQVLLDTLIDLAGRPVGPRTIT